MLPSSADLKIGWMICLIDREAAVEALAPVALVEGQHDLGLVGLGQREGAGTDRLVHDLGRQLGRVDLGEDCRGQDVGLGEHAQHPADVLGLLADRDDHGLVVGGFDGVGDLEERCGGDAVVDLAKGERCSHILGGARRAVGERDAVLHGQRDGVRAVEFVLLGEARKDLTGGDVPAKQRFIDDLHRVG